MARRGRKETRGNTGSEYRKGIGELKPREGLPIKATLKVVQRGGFSQGCPGVLLLLKSCGQGEAMEGKKQADEPLQNGKVGGAPVSTPYFMHIKKGERKGERETREGNKRKTLRSNQKRAKRSSMKGGEGGARE